MPVRHHEQLIAWQLCHELELKVYVFTGRPPVSRDAKFCIQIRDSAGSAPRNIAEGFWRFRHSEMSNFLNIARGSLGETMNHLRKALRRKYISLEEFDEMWSLARRGLAATTRLQVYVQTTPDPVYPQSGTRGRHRSGR